MKPENRLRLFRTLARIPPLSNDGVRAYILGAYKESKWKRTKAAELLGWKRFSRPAAGNIDTALAQRLGSAGVFVEAGANDGFRQSNTYFLERFCDWSGVLVEPIPSLAKKAAQRRPRSKVFNCALVADDYRSDTIVVRYVDLMSGIGIDLDDASWGWEAARDIEVSARTLTSVLEEAGVDQIDLLSLDVEGYEASVLAGLDLVRFRPEYVLLETRGGGIDALTPHLSGYEVRGWLTPTDVLFARSSESRTGTPAG